jgi:hypothetical protein
MEILPSGKFFTIDFIKECVYDNFKTNKILVYFDHERKNEIIFGFSIN